jgi:hypothetical protein
MLAPPSAIVFHPSWPAPAQALLRRAIDRHGGWSLWQRLEAVTVNLASMGGFLPWLKGSGRTFRLCRSLTTFPKTVRTEWSEEAGRPRAVVFDRGDMRLLDPGGAIRRESLDHRRSFRGRRRWRRWDDLDAHYFFGYAFASYTAVPFILPGLTFLGDASGTSSGERLRGVRVRHPTGAQVHSSVQTYFFDSSGLLRRNDYVADVVGAIARGAHFWDDFATVGGLPLPARRTVLFRAGTAALPRPAVLSATFASFDLHLAS